MLKSKTSAYISLGVCIASAVLLVAWLFKFPAFIRWFYFRYHLLAQDEAMLNRAVSLLIPAFYICAPFAAAALWMLIRLLLNVLHTKIFIRANVLYLRYVSWCCYAVLAVTFGFGLRYAPLMIVAFAMGVVGTLLRVVKNILQAAVELREENDLTI